MDLISVCETDIATDNYECCEVLQSLYAHTRGRGAWIGRRLRVHPPLHPPFARDDSGRTWTLSHTTSVTSDTETLDIEAMLKRYVYEEYWQQAQDDLRYREKCVNGVYIPSPDFHHDSSSEGDVWT